MVLKSETQKVTALTQTSFQRQIILQQKKGKSQWRKGKEAGNNPKQHRKTIAPKH
jgi:hypothetical protein